MSWKALRIKEKEGKEFVNKLPVNKETGRKDLD